MAKVKLEQNEWHYNPKSSLGEVGGFGRVHTGTDIEKNLDVAVKRLNIMGDEAEHRELDIAEKLKTRNLEYVLPILDSGIDAYTDRYFVIMPIADKSLQDKLNDEGKLSENEAIQILIQIVKGLLEIDDIVHRDLKPSNILLHNGKWKLADFGIARFVEKATSKRTVKEYLSYEYTAPEQWNYERTTKATDVYALGIIAFELLTSRLPYDANTREEYKDAHLNKAPQRLAENFNPKLNSLVSLMLRKSPNVRPSLKRILELLEQVLNDKKKEDSSAFEMLAQADVIYTQKQLENEAKEAEIQNRFRSRGNTCNEALEILNEIIDELVEKILISAPTAQERNGRTFGGLISKIKAPPIKGIELSNAKLLFSRIGTIHEDSFPESKWDVLAGAIVQVEQIKPQYLWGANLWYTNAGDGTNYRWYEVPYFRLNSGNYVPFAITNYKDADMAASHVMDIFQHAARPICPIDLDSLDSFFYRWAGLLAKASLGGLPKPHYLPIPNYCENRFLHT